MKVQSWPASRPLTGGAPDGGGPALGERPGAAGSVRGAGVGVPPGPGVVGPPGAAVADGDAIPPGDRAGDGAGVVPPHAAMPTIIAAVTAACAMRHILTRRESARSRL
jgi:hypothetical protein